LLRNNTYIELSAIVKKLQQLNYSHRRFLSLRYGFNFDFHFILPLIIDILLFIASNYQKILFEPSSLVVYFGIVIMKNNKKSLVFSLLKVSLSRLMFLLFVTTSHDLYAQSQFYIFEGKLTNFSDPYTSTATKAGYELDDFIHYVVEIDFDRQGYFISPTNGGRVTPNDTQDTDFFYANLISGTEIIHFATPGAVFENLGANKIDPNQGYINLASYLVLINGNNPVDWKVGDVLTSSDRWTIQAPERLEGQITLLEILDSPPVNDISLNNWENSQFNREITNFISHHPVSDTFYLSARPYGGLYEKGNNSSIFSTRIGDLVDTNIKDLAFSQNSTSNLYAATLNGGIYKSFNGGNTWTKSNNGMELNVNQSTDAYSIAVSPSNSQVLYSGTLFGLHKSVDAGDNWQLETTPFNDSIISFIKITEQDEIFVGTHKGLYMGSVSGNSWSDLTSNNNTNISDIKLHPSMQNIIAIGIRSGGAFLYHIDSGLFEKLIIGPTHPNDDFLIHFAGVSGETIYVAASESGLFRSDDFNQTWSQLNLPAINGTDMPVNSFDIDSNEMIMIGSNHNGVYTIEKSMQLVTPVVFSGKPDNVVADSGGAFGILTFLIFGFFWMLRYRITG